MTCPMCDGPGVLLGQLGQRVHYRCRNCGMDYSTLDLPACPACGSTEPDCEPGCPAVPERGTHDDD